MVKLSILMVRRNDFTYENFLKYWRGSSCASLRRPVEIYWVFGFCHHSRSV
jgi:hypothetical protein